LFPALINKESLVFVRTLLKGFNLSLLSFQVQRMPSFDRFALKANFIRIQDGRRMNKRMLATTWANHLIPSCVWNKYIHLIEHDTNEVLDRLQ
jgi:hypothetical protein